MILDTETFELWMLKIMERFDRHERMLSSLTDKEVKEVMYVDGERLLDNQDLCQLLQTSKQSLQRYRSSGMLHCKYPLQYILSNSFDVFTFVLMPE